MDKFALTTKRLVLGHVSVCQGCCCGNTANGKPAVPIEWLKKEWRAIGGIENGGWRLTYSSMPNQRTRARENVTGRMDLSFSLGIGVAIGKRSGQIEDVIPGTPAAEAGLAPAMRIVSVNGHSFTVGALRDAIESAQKNAKSILITVTDSGAARSYEIQYQGGERYPHLERNSDLPDLLTQSLQPLTAPKP
jgi:predicted metalloprotease with PDZ domain